MKWIGATIKVVSEHDLSRARRPHRVRLIPSAAKRDVTINAKVHLPIGDQSLGPSKT